MKPRNTTFLTSAVAPGPRVLAFGAALIASRPAELIRLSVQQSVQRLLYRAADHLVQMLLNPAFVDLNHLVQAPHTFFLLSRFHLASVLGFSSSPCSISQSSSTQMCEWSRDVTRLFRLGPSVSGPFVCRCLIIQTVPRLHIPLIEPDMRN